MLGVHGDGLTSVLRMKPTARSTFMEFFFPEYFAHDYERATRALGITHYGSWGNRYDRPVPGGFLILKFSL